MRSDWNALKDRWRQRREGHGMGDGWWKPTEGKHRLRLLPPPDHQEEARFKQKAFYVDYGVHYEIGEEGTEPITCPKATLQKGCPICEFAKPLWKTGKLDDEKLARKIGVKHRAVSNIVLLNDPSKVWIWSYPKSTREQLEDICFANEELTAMIDDPDAGNNIILTVTMRATSEGTFPHQSITPELKSCQIPDKGVLSKITNLAEMIGGRVKSYDELRSILHGNRVSLSEPSAARPSVSAPSTEVVEEVIEEIPQASVPPTLESRPSSADVIARAKAALAARKQAENK